MFWCLNRSDGGFPDRGFLDSGLDSGGVVITINTSETNYWASGGTTLSNLP